MSCKKIDQAKIYDPLLRAEWSVLLKKLELTVSKLNQVDLGPLGDSSNLKYFELMNDFMQARDDERTFYWDNFLIG